MLKYALLGFLNYSPMTGYELKQRIDRSTTHFWHAKLSQIYTTLKAMRAADLVSSSIEEQQERPDRRVYSITQAGRVDLQAWLSEPYTGLSPKKETLVLKLFFSAQVDPAAVLNQLRLQRDLHRKQLDYYHREAVQNIRHAEADFPMLAKDAELWEATRRFGELYEDVYVKWIEEMIEQIGRRAIMDGNTNASSAQ